MNTDSGELYQLIETEKMLRKEHGDRLEAEDLEGQETADAERARQALDRREAIVLVSEQAAQKVALGERELRRRRRRSRGVVGS